jgi:hypothetical protein
MNAEPWEVGASLAVLRVDMHLTDNSHSSTQLFRFCDRIRGGVGIRSIQIRAHLGNGNQALQTGEYHFIEWREPSAKPEPSRRFPALFSIHIEIPGEIRHVWNAQALSRFFGPCKVVWCPKPKLHDQPKGNHLHA